MILSFFKERDAISDFMSRFPPNAFCGISLTLTITSVPSIIGGLHSLLAMDLIPDGAVPIVCFGITQITYFSVSEKIARNSFTKYMISLSPGLSCFIQRTNLEKASNSGLY